MRAKHRELKLFSSASESGGVDHCLRIDQRGTRRSFDLDEEAIHALAVAIAALEKDPNHTGELPINESLPLRSEPPSFVLSNCEVSFKFLAFENFKQLYERIQERAFDSTTVWVNLD